MFNATNWQDSDYINFKVFMIVDQTYITLSDQVPQVLPESSPTLMYFRLPLFTADPKVVTKNVSVCVLAVDYHFATAQKCIVLDYAKNNVLYASNLDILKN